MTDPSPPRPRSLLGPLAAFALLALLYAGWRALPRGPTAPPPRAPAAPAGPEGRIGSIPRARFYIERDRFLPATDPRVVGAAQATFLEPADEVFGVVVAGEARAYPIPMLAYHHVVNDVIQGIPVAVTY